jgi:hypothetical protein
MGKNFIDKYSLLHLATGIIFRFFNISLLNSFIIHTIFEFVENTKPGMYFINTYLPFWPGGKPSSDSLLNNIGDTLFFILGWIIANLVNYK